MHKGVKAVILGSALVLSACVGTPDSQDFLRDASATCGDASLFKPDRTFEAAPGTVAVSQSYDCINAYLQAHSEYPDSPSDKAFVATVRQIDLLRATGRLTPEQARQQMQAAVATHGG